MKAKRLLNLGMMLACGLSMQAQTNVFHESFDAEQAKQPTDVAWYEFVNNQEGDERTINTTEAYAGAGCMNFFNAAIDTTWWRRAIKFRNLPLQEGKSYRLSFRFKGDNTWNIDGTTTNKSKMNVALMQGVEEADIPMLDANGNEFKYELSYFNAEQYEKYTKMFYFASEALQKSTYAEKNPDKDPLADKYFATFNIYNPGEYYLDEVDLSESPIAGVDFGGDVIRVDFGYATNITDLVKSSAIGRVLMPTDCASVTLNGTEVAVDGVELQADGYMYIFLADESFESGDNNKIEIAFKNPTDESYQVKYKGTLAPEGAAVDFSGEVGEYNESVSEIASFAYTEPDVTSTLPENGSFALDESMTEVSFTFDKPVLTVDDNDQPLVVKLNGSEDLVLATEAPAEGGVNTLTFKRQGGQAFPKGSYTVTLEGVTSTKIIKSSKTFTLDFETGKMQLAETVYTDLFTNLLQGQASGQPTGWTIMVGGENWTGGDAKADNGSGCRNFIATGSDGNPYTAFYLCDREGYTYMQYGDKEDARITLPAGDIEFSIIAIGHEAAARTLEYRLEDMDGNEVLRANGTTSVQAENFTTIEAAGTISAKFNNPKEQNFILKIHEPDGGFTAARVLGFKARSYTMTPGESTEAEIAFEDKIYGGKNAVATKDNTAPTEGTGWSLYQEGAKRTPGQDYNYNGTRIFSLSVKNMSFGYYTNGGWPNNYVIYGEGNEEGTEPLLHLKSGRHQFTYYAANWKEASANSGKDHIVYFELGDKATATNVYTREDKIVNCDMNGNRSAAISPQMIQFTVNIPTEGDYTMKLGGTTEQLIGNYKIEKLGSQTAYYLGLIKTARGLAIEELKTSEDATYNGTSKTALQASVDKYEDLSSITTPAQANAAKSELETLTKTMATRREYVSRYGTALQSAATLLSEVGEKADAGEETGHAATKYAQLEAFTALEAVYQTYSEKTAQQLEDAELISATSDIENNTTWLTNMKNKCVALLTKQLVDAAATLVKYDETMTNNEQVLAAGNALTDDQVMANILKLRITKAIYEKCAGEGNPFSVLDQEIMEEVADSINLACFIQNANLYTTEITPNRTLTDPKNLPGWNINQIKGTPGLEVSWVAWNANKYCPVNDQYLICGWYSEWDINQMVNNLPVGKYRYVASTQDRGFADTSDDKKAALATRDHWTATGNTGEGEVFSYIYWKVGEKTDSIGYDITNQGQYYGFTDCNSKTFNIPATGEANTGEVTIGSHALEFQSQASIDAFRLYMVGKDASFDYANAAKKIEEDITGVENVAGAPEGEPVSVRFYDLSGKMTTQPQGITIKVANYKNGFIKVSKVLVK